MQCPQCSRINLDSATRCTGCGAGLPGEDQPADDTLRPGGLYLRGECLECGEINPMLARRCGECDAELPKESRPQGEGSITWAFQGGPGRDITPVLLCPPLTPVRLKDEKGTKYVIGRGETTDITLPGELVSRHHATLTHDGEAFVLEDLGSANRTYHNGEQVQDPVKLEDGDSIAIGGFQMQFQLRRRQQVSDRELLHEVQSAPTHIFEEPKDSPSSEEGMADEHGSLSGQLHDVALVRLLSFVHVNGLTGTLELAGQDLDGWVAYVAGRITSAWSGPDPDQLRDREALARLVDHRDGTFNFTRSEQEHEPTIREATPELLAWLSSNL